jgi:hypothetical protein
MSYFSVSILSRNVHVCRMVRANSRVFSGTSQSVAGSFIFCDPELHGRTDMLLELQNVCYTFNLMFSFI